MKTIWQRIENWLSIHSPVIRKSLHPSISDAELKNLETIIGCRLPEDFIEFYKIHNGQKTEAEGLIDAEELLSATRIIEEWTVWNHLLNKGDFTKNDGSYYTSTPDKGIKNYWWNPKWIPVSYDGSGNHYCMDLDPEKDGNYGQIIRMWHDDPARELIASSFSQWMKEFAEDLEKGAFIYSKEYGGVIKKEFL